jgi:hypothetical protein
MKEKGFSSRTLSYVSCLSDRTIRRMKGDDMYEPTREMVIAACVGLGLTLDESLDLIHKSAYRLRRDAPIDAVYLEILENRARERGACRIWLEGSKWGLPVYKKYGFSENNTILTIENELKQED